MQFFIFLQYTMQRRRVETSHSSHFFPCTQGDSYSKVENDTISLISKITDKLIMFALIKYTLKISNKRIFYLWELGFYNSFFGILNYSVFTTMFFIESIAKEPEKQNFRCCYLQQMFQNKIITQTSISRTFKNVLLTFR